MAKYTTVEGAGSDLANAKKDLCQKLKDVSLKGGFVTPGVEEAIDYTVSVRKQGKAYVSGDKMKKLDEALESAWAAADYGSGQQRIRVSARYELQKEAPAEKGQPSGAAPSEYGNRKNITDLF